MTTSSLFVLTKRLKVFLLNKRKRSHYLLERCSRWLITTAIYRIAISLVYLFFLLLFLTIEFKIRPALGSCQLTRRRKEIRTVVFGQRALTMRFVPLKVGLSDNSLFPFYFPDTARHSHTRVVHFKYWSAEKISSRVTWKWGSFCSDKTSSRCRCCQSFLILWVTNSLRALNMIARDSNSRQDIV